MGIIDTKALLSRYKELIFEKTVLEQHLDDQEDNDIRERLVIIGKHLQMLEQCFAILSTDEAFVIKSHMLSGRKWSDVQIMYEKQFGYENAKAERTLKQVQAKALEKIAALIANTNTGIYFRKLLCSPVYSELYTTEGVKLSALGYRDIKTIIRVVQ